MQRKSVSKKITHAYTSSQGVVVVITGVPALCAVDSDGREECVFEWKVARRIEELINNSIRSNPATMVHVLSWDATEIEIPADVEVRVKGPGMQYGQARLSVWRTAFERVAIAYRSIAKPFAQQRGIQDIPSPVVAFAGPGSLSIGLKAHSNLSLFDPQDLPPDVVTQVLNIIIDVSAWLNGDEQALPEDIRNNPILLDASLRSVAELAPSEREDGQAIELISRRERSGKVVRAVLTGETRKLVTKRRMDIALESSESRPVTLTGIVDVIKLNGEFHMRDVAETIVEWQRPVATWTYQRDMLPDLLRFFGQRVRVSGIQRKHRDQWSQKLEALDVGPVESAEPVT